MLFRIAVKAQPDHAGVSLPCATQRQGEGVIPAIEGYANPAKFLHHSTRRETDNDATAEAIDRKLEWVRRASGGGASAHWRCQ